MITATLGEAAAAMGGTLRGDAETRFTGVTTDSRSVPPGSLFVALSGPTFDGNDFAAEAVARGAVAAVVSRDVEGLPREIRVDDTLRALGDLAAWHRNRFGRLAVVGITGTSGKTTTKDILTTILTLRRRVVATEGNLNNRIGVPLTLFGVGPDTEVAVIEMGMSEPGEIARLAEIARPDIGIVTNAGAGHLEGLGSVEGVAKEKGDLLAAAATSVLDRESEGFRLLAPRARGRLVTVGRTAEADRRIGNIVSRGLGGTRFVWRGVEIELRLPGSHFVSNAALAAATAEELGLDSLDVWLAIPTVRAREGRGRLVEEAGVKYFNDAYNANPLSFHAALGLLRDSEAPRKILVMGDMLELGPAGPDLHRVVGRSAAKALATPAGSRLFAIGPLSAYAVEAAGKGGLDAVHFDSPDDLVAKVVETVRSGDLVLFKASHGMRLEKVLEAVRSEVRRRRGGSVVPLPRAAGRAE